MYLALETELEFIVVLNKVDLPGACQGVERQRCSALQHTYWLVPALQLLHCRRQCLLPRLSLRLGQPDQVCVVKLACVLCCWVQELSQSE